MKAPPRGTLNFRPVSQDNWESLARLQVTSEQESFVEPNLWSIAESAFYPQLHPVGIFKGNVAVGFLMWGFSPDDNRPWLYRFMIDAEFQGQGLGTAALRKLVDQLSNEGIPELNVGYHRDNTVAERLYLSAGFRKSGPTPWGELSARIDF